VSDTKGFPRLYQELAEWWPVLSQPDDYDEWGELFSRAIIDASTTRPVTLLELGSGGGSNAFRMKKHFQLTLTDIAPGMIRVSQEMNPECEHIVGDMRTIRLACQFDAVFIEDAILYMTTEDDLRQALKTAYEHCKPGGVALFNPGDTLEIFKPSTGHGGNDRGDRSLRYLDWCWDPDPNDTTYISYMVYVLREGDDVVRCVEDKHTLGVFSRSAWLRLITEVGFEARYVPLYYSEGSAEAFLGLRPE
jgi:ubiquinone/menaquinone biosynthesis C-methylase UbiE